MLIQPCDWHANDFLASANMLPRGQKPLSKLSNDELFAAIDEVAAYVVGLVGADSASSPSGDQPAQAELVPSTNWTHSGNREIHARHLAAALLLEIPAGPPSGAHERLVELGVPPATLRAVLLEALTSNVAEDNPDQWAVLLSGPADKRVYISAYDADSARGKKDYLGVTPDVNAFASLIAATTVVPPLSIGLFGDWGSGKSFFMHQLKQTVDDLARQARAEQRAQQRSWKRSSSAARGHSSVRRIPTRRCEGGPCTGPNAASGLSPTTWRLPTRESTTA